MDTLNRVKNSKLSQLQCNLDLCEISSRQVNEKLDNYKLIAAEHEWAMEMIKMLKTSCQECESQYEILVSSFFEWKLKIQEIGLTLQDFKVKLDECASVVRNFINEQDNHIAFLKETRDKVENATDKVQLEMIDVPMRERLYGMPDFEYDRMAKLWERTNMINRLMEVLLKQSELMK